MASAAVDCASYGPDVGSGNVGCRAAASNAGSLIPPSGRIGIWVSVAANDERGAGSVNVTEENEVATLMPLRAVARVGSVACAESANASGAGIAGTGIGEPLDPLRFDWRATE